MSKNSKIKISRRGSEPYNKDKIFPSRKKSDDNITENKYPSFKNNIYKAMFGSKKIKYLEDKNNLTDDALTSNSLEIKTQKKEEISSSEDSKDTQAKPTTPTHFDKNNDLFGVEGELSHKLNIKNYVEITREGNKFTTIRTDIIEKNNSKPLISEEFNPLFQTTNLGQKVINLINQNKDKEVLVPIHIFYQNHSIEDLSNGLIQTIETIDVNNQGSKIISNTNFDLNDLNTLTSMNGEAINIKITSPQASPNIKKHTDLSDSSYIEVLESAPSINTSNNLLNNLTDYALTSNSLEIETQKKETFSSGEDSWDTQVSPNTSVHFNKKNDSFSIECELSYKLHIKCEREMTREGNKFTAVTTYIIEKNNSKPLILVERDPIFKITNLGPEVINLINQNQDKEVPVPIHILFKNHTIKDLSNKLVQTIETININNQGVKVMSTTTPILNTLPNINDDAINIKITLPQASPNIKKHNDLSDSSYFDLSEPSIYMSNSISLTGQTLDGVVEG